MTTKETEKTTIFTDQASKVCNTGYHLTHDDDLTVKFESIKDFLGKPYLVQQWTWGPSGTNPAGNVINTYDVASLLTTNTVWMNKLQGFNLIRGRVHFKILLQANPFMQGIMALRWFPNYDSTNAEMVAMHTAISTNLGVMPSIGQLPGVDLDCRDACAELDFPFLSPVHYFDVKEAYFTWGRLYAFPLAPLNTGTGGETVVDISVYMWFSDIEMSAPQYPQSTIGTKKKYSVKKFSNSEVNKEEKLYQISSTLATISKGASVLSVIPHLGSSMSGLAWASDLLSGVAAKFGYGKPVSMGTPCIMSSQYDRYAAVCDGEDVAVSLAAFKDNATVIADDMSLRSEDEMSLRFLLDQESIIATVNWSDSQASNTNLYTKKVCPSNLCAYGTTVKSAHTISWTQGPPVHYLSNIFGMWRGSIRLRLRFSKTQFHSGRLQITWIPNKTVTQSVSGANGLTYTVLNLREIVDLRTSNECEFILPYMLDQNYLPTQAAGASSDVSANYMGQFDIVVLNELRAPTSCANNIDMIIYASAGPDFELQNPGPAFGVSPLPFSTQSRELFDRVIADAEPVKNINLAYSSRSTGELVTSIKQLLARYCGIQQIAQTTFNTGLLFWPFFASVPYGSNVAGGLAGPNVGGDLYSYLAPMYAYYRGPVNVKFDNSIVTASADIFACVATNSLNAGTTTVLTNNASWFKYFPPASSNYLANGTNATGVAVSSTPQANWRIPYYSKTRFSQVRCNTNSNVIPNTTDVPISILAMGAQLNSTAYFLLRSFPDEFQLGMYLGCPPSFISST